MTLQQGTGHVGISNYLKNVLVPSITTIRIQNIFDHELTDLAGFPAATITASDLAGEFLDNMRNQRGYRFMIRIFIERSKLNVGTQEAESTLRTVMDEFIQRFDADPTLGGNCIYTRPGTARYGYVDREQNNIRVAEITLDAFDAITWR